MSPKWWGSVPCWGGGVVSGRCGCFAGMRSLGVPFERGEGWGLSLLSGGAFWGGFLGERFNAIDWRAISFYRIYMHAGYNIREL